ncbi:MAG: aminotransferase class I/II-fold pyridoxal phosphate-dependent enzyme [Cyclobacteriaceae bacterium]
MIISNADRLLSTEEYYFSVKLKEIARLRKKGHQIINLGIGSPDLPPEQSVIGTLQASSENSSAHGYQGYQGITDLRQAIASYSKKHLGFAPEPDSEVLPLMGSKEGIMHCSLAFINPGDTVMIPDPGYPTYASVSTLVQADIQTYSLSAANNWNIDISQLKKAPLDKVKVFWLNYPHMPTGVQADSEIISELIVLAKKHRFLIINDNPYNQLWSPPAFSIFQLPGSEEVALELNSMSKSHNMAGWRLGWISGHKDYISAILKVKSNMDSGMFLPIQKAAITALQLEDDFYEKQRAIYSERRQIAQAIFDKLNCTYTSQEGMFTWAEIPPDAKGAEDFADSILQEFDIFITPGSIFGKNGSRFLRISLCSPGELLTEALNRIKYTHS